MRVFQIKGFTGLVMFIMAAIGVACASLLLPSAFVMVLWNALVFEGFGGPEITVLQALPLWIAVLIAFKLIANPQISLQFHKVNDPADLERSLKDLKNKHSQEK